MIDLFSVKLNNKYDFIQDSLPVSNATWLCSKTYADYTKGFSYEITDGKATRIEINQDYSIQNCIYPTTETVLTYLNNMFLLLNPISQCGCDRYKNFVYQQATFTFNNNQIKPANNSFKQGDLIFISGQRNKFLSHIAGISGSVLTLTNMSLQNCTENATIFVCIVPESVQNIISKMIHFDIFIRDVPSELKSENIGNYNYTLATYNIGCLAYPPQIVNNLEQFKKAKFL